MFVDLNNSAALDFEQPNYDVAIVGAGAAGITLATTLARAGKSVALIEGGDKEYSEESQNLYKGEVFGDPYFELDVARLRYLGGTTNHWGGWCRSFERVDFEREYLGDEYKWPIPFSELERYKAPACDILEIPYIFRDKDIPSSGIKEIEFQFSPPVLFKEKFYNELDTSSLITVFLNANLKNFQGNNRRIKSIGVESFSGKRLALAARKFVLAMGGIENSRFLLWIGDQNRGEFFDQGLPIGSYWMEHPHFTLGEAIVDRSKVSNRFYSLTEVSQKNLKILNCGLRVEHLNDQGTKALIRDVLCVAPSLGNKLVSLAGKNLVCGVQFRAAWEQSPDVTNAVKLSTEVDRLGIPKVELHWKKNALDHDTLRKSVGIFNSWLLEEDAGRIRLDEWILNDGQYPEDDELAGYHHMGGTRMHNSRRYGVVDANSQVHGAENLFVAGSSVFTTGGHNNPTLPIVQLSLRLSDHLSID